MRILQIIASVDPAGGGVVEGVRQLGATLVTAGHSVEIASIDAPDAPFLRNSSLPVYALGPGISKYGFSAKVIPWLRANHSRYDAVVVNGLWQFHSFATWRALRKTGTPYVLYTHGMLDPWFKKRYPLKHLKKWLYWPWAEYRVLRDAQVVLFTCEEERLLARESFWLYRCEEAVVSLGTSKPTGQAALEMQEFNSRFPQLGGKKVLLFMGRIHPKKGCDLLIEAFARVLSQDPHWQLVMAGPDQVGWRGELEHHAARVGMDKRITWTGMLGGALKWGAIRMANAFILPSHQENFGVAVAESLAAGVPVLISNKVNIWREVERDEAGLVAEDTLEGTCKLLDGFAQLSEERTLAMRRNASNCFSKRFEIGRAARNLEAVLSRIAITN
jgi:glycosyltransferase involved in cell wall biosynthesis